MDRIKCLKKSLNKAREKFDNPDDVLEYVSDQCGGYGVEAVSAENAWVSHYYQNIIALYVNFGDTYDTTVVYDTEWGEYNVMSWGDWYENWMAEQQEPEMDGLSGRPGMATDKQIRYLMYLLQKNGYSTKWMSSDFKKLGATMRERSGRVIDWLENLTIGEASELINYLK